MMFEVIYFVDLPEYSMVFDISQVIRFAKRLILFPGVQRWNKHTVSPVRGCSVFVHDVSIRPIYSSGNCSGRDDEREQKVPDLALL